MSGTKAMLDTRHGFECHRERKAMSSPYELLSKIQRNVLFTVGKTTALINCASVYASIL